MLIINTL